MRDAGGSAGQPLAVMPELKPPPSDPGSQLAALLRRALDQALYLLMNWLSFLRSKTEDTRHQLKEVFYSTSDQVLERAEETRKSVKLRMAILEIEHHLNRLYPQIGKLTCDLHLQHPEGWPEDGDLRAKVELAEEYRQRLQTLHGELEQHQQRIRSQRG
jgi:hypothetical protein